MFWRPMASMARAGSGLAATAIALTLLVVACNSQSQPAASPTPALQPTATQAAKPTATAAAAPEVAATPTNPPEEPTGHREPSGLDFGDAPESGDVGYPGSEVTASFPSSFGNDGTRVRNPGADTLGPGVSDEADANPANTDGSDDGVSGLILDLSATPAQASVVTHVAIAADAPDGPRFLNVLIDLNADGTWERAASDDAGEWVVQNFELTVSPGSSERIVLPAFTYGDTATLIDAAWMRVLLSRRAIATPDWSGAGEFDFGEVEDYLVRLDSIPAPVIECPDQISVGGTFLRPVTCTGRKARKRAPTGL